MNRKCLFILTIVFLFFYAFNYLTPLSFGDDYIYSFVWQGHSMYVPLTEEAVRISSIYDILESQLLHYMTGNGRLVNHTIAQFFLWLGKSVFNFFNTFVAVLLIIEIYWCAHKGKISCNFRAQRLCWIFFALWAFSPGYSPVFFWLTGACNYLWTAVLLLGFMLPYIRKYYSFYEEIDKGGLFKYGMFFFGIIAGWTNENSICWIILVLFLFIIISRKQDVFETWMYTGFAGLIIGYALLMLAPGNMIRLHAETKQSVNWLTGDLLKQNLVMLATVFLFHFLLWYFNIRSLFSLKQKELQVKKIQREIWLIKTLCLAAFGMTAMMVVSPTFPPRSAFPGTVQLIIATTILLRVQDEYGIEIIQSNAQKFLTVVCVLYFFVTASVSLYGFYDYNVQMQQLVSTAKHAAQAKENTITVRPLKEVSETMNHASGLHLIYYKMSENENDWRNVAFARYYGLKGIRMAKAAKDAE